MTEKTEHTAYKILSAFLFLTILPLTLMLSLFYLLMGMPDSHLTEFQRASRPLWILIIAAGTLYCPLTLIIGWRKLSAGRKKQFLILNLIYFACLAFFFIGLLVLSMALDTGHGG